MIYIDKDLLILILEQYIIAFLFFIKIPLTDKKATTENLCNTFINNVRKPNEIENFCNTLEGIVFIHKTIEIYRHEPLLYKFNLEELSKYKPIRK